MTGMTRRDCLAALAAAALCFALACAGYDPQRGFAARKGVA